MSEENKSELDFMSKPKFSKLVEDAVYRLRLSYMDAVIHCCEENGIEVEDARKYVSTVIKSKLEAEAMRLNFLTVEKKAELPI
jgi:hypothetical protein